MIAYLNVIRKIVNCAFFFLEPNPTYTLKLSSDRFLLRQLFEEPLPFLIFGYISLWLIAPCEIL
jgi:hypothetical protein